MTTKNLTKLAQEYRAKYAARGWTGGVVIIHDGHAVGWCQDLPETRKWVPGCYAVDQDGRVWLATGGDDCKGCEWWEPVDHPVETDEMVCPKCGKRSIDTHNKFGFWACEMARAAGEGEA